MKSLFEEMGGTYRQEGDYLIPNLALPDEPEYQIGKYGRMRRSYLKEHRPVLYASLLTSGTLHRHLAEIDQACNERMAIIVSDMARQEDVTEALKAADQMEWVIGEEQYDALHPGHFEEFDTHVSHLCEEVAEKAHDLTVEPIHDLAEELIGNKIPNKH